MFISFKRGKKENLQQVDILPGSLYLTTDTSSLFIDDENLTRIQLNDTNAMRFEIESEIEFGKQEEENE